MGCGTRPGGSSGRPTPTHRLTIDYRRGRRPRRPASVIRGAVCGGTHGSRPTLHYFVGQGPCALPWVREKSGSGRCRHRPLRKRILWCVGEGLCPSRGRPQGSPLRRVSRWNFAGSPHPFSPHFLFSVCGFPVDKLPIPIFLPFLWKFILFPVDKKSMDFAALRGFSTKVFSTTIITKKYLVYVLWAENMPGNFGIRKESVPC